MTTTAFPPSLALPHADQAEAKLTARDITRGVYEDVIGPHDQTHRKD
ncbi:MAG: hypothetical protein L0G94_10530 [Brachybacterium sp.]|nr:hypothetical protein [Brachybacterium sp.]MDN5687091.1 hypothetical protein [Brachybacterium sp.]